MLPHEQIREKDLHLGEDEVIEYDVMDVKQHGTEEERKEKYKKCLAYERPILLKETKGYLRPQDTKLLSMMYCQYLYYADLVIPE